VNQIRTEIARFLEVSNEFDGPEAGDGRADDFAGQTGPTVGGERRRKVLPVFDGASISIRVDPFNNKKFMIRLDRLRQRRLG